jgi:hypothetical protein
MRTVLGRLPRQERIGVQALCNAAAEQVVDRQRLRGAPAGRRLLLQPRAQRLRRHAGVALLETAASTVCTHSAAGDT